MTSAVRPSRGDNVDEEFFVRPRKWDASSIGSFMLWLGPSSSVFVFATYTYLFMYFIFCPASVSGGILFSSLASYYQGAELVSLETHYIRMFQTGWFVESMWTLTLVIHMLRTPKLSFIQSHASAPVTIALLTIIPFTPIGAELGLTALPAAYFAYLLPCILLYMLLATFLKKAYIHHHGEFL